MKEESKALLWNELTLEHQNVFAESHNMNEMNWNDLSQSTRISLADNADSVIQTKADSSEGNTSPPNPARHLDNRMDVIPDWEFMASQLDNGIEFNFASSAENNCPGYVFEISNWCLQRATTAPPLPLENSENQRQYIFWWAIYELERVLGDNLSEEYKKAKLDLNALRDNALPTLRRPPGAGVMPKSLIPTDWFSPQYREELNAAEDRCHRACIKAIESPNIFRLYMSLLHLMRRDGVSYHLKKKPWPFQMPPCRLYQMAKIGFKTLNASTQPFGILAFQSSCDDAWIISSFKQTDVVHYSNRNNLTNDCAETFKNGEMAELKHSMEQGFAELKLLIQVDANAASQDMLNAPASTRTITTNRFQLLDDKWQYIIVDEQFFNLGGRNQIKGALKFLYDNGYTSATGQRTTVAKVCEAAGQKAQVSNLHSIFHVVTEAKSPEVDYDKLYDLVIDSQRGLGVLLKI